jgi:ATP-dependent DNA ligase
VLRDGGEGVVAKPFAAHFGFDLVKVKRSETHDCIVTEIHPFKRSVRLSQNGIDRGWCSVAGRQINIGDVVEIICYGVTANGKLREPRLYRLRNDK